MTLYTLEVVFNCIENNDITLKEGEPTADEIERAEESQIAIYK